MLRSIGHFACCNTIPAAKLPMRTLPLPSPTAFLGPM
jgi:hypothetical protein